MVSTTPRNTLASHVGVLGGSSHVPAPLSVGQERVTNPLERLRGRLVTPMSFEKLSLYRVIKSKGKRLVKSAEQSGNYFVFARFFCF